MTVLFDDGRWQCHRAREQVGTLPHAERHAVLIVRIEHELVGEGYGILRESATRRFHCGARVAWDVLSADGWVRDAK